MELTNKLEFYILELKKLEKLGDSEENQERAGIEDGKEIGIKIGKRNGKKETQLEIAKNLLENNVDIEIIIKSTGLKKKK